MHEIIEEKERFVDEELIDDKKKLPQGAKKGVDVKKDIKKPMVKKDEERKKETYFETFTTKLRDSVVVNVSYGNKLVRLWDIGDIQIVNNDLTETTESYRL